MEYPDLILMLSKTQERVIHDIIYVLLQSKHIIRSESFAMDMYFQVNFLSLDRINEFVKKKWKQQ